MKRTFSNPANPAYLLFFMVFITIVCVGFHFSKDNDLVAATKKKKQEKQVARKRCAVPAHNKNEDQLKEYYNYTAQDNQKILDQIIILSANLEKRFIELEQLSLYHDEVLADIKDCLYKKYITPNYCPFEYFKKWFDDPFDKSGIDIKRHPVCEGIEPK
jgi:hypothetical protein